MSTEVQSASPQFPVALQPFELPAGDGPVVSYDTRLGERCAAIEVFTDNVADLMRSYGMDDAAIAATPIAVSAESRTYTDPKDGEVYATYGECGVTTGQITLYFGSSYETFADRGDYARGLVVGELVGSRVENNLAHEVSHRADQVSTAVGPKVRRVAHEVGHALVRSVPQMMSFATVGGAAIATERVTEAANAFRGAGNFVAVLGTTLMGALAVMRIREVIQDLHYQASRDNFYYQHPDEVRARERAEAFRNTATAPLAAVILHQDVAYYNHLYGDEY